MRRELQQLDELKMGDLWSDASRRTPGPDVDAGPDRPTSSRVAAGVVAFLVAGAGFAFVWKAFHDNGTTAMTGPDPASVCPSSSHADPAYIEVGGVEVTTDVLQPAGVHWDQITQLPRAALDSFFMRPEVIRLEDVPQDGWRPILEEAERVELAAPVPNSKSWYYVTFIEQGGGWSVAGWGAHEPAATPAQRGAGLRLEWHGDVTYDRHSLNTGIWLVNDRDTTWVDDRGEYWAIVHLFDPATGQAIRMNGGTAGVGRTYRLAPGESVELPLAFGDLTSVPDGRYDAVACVPDLALASSVGTVVLTPRTETAPVARPTNS
ncbi:MAG: hypothetical protein QOG88_1733 [Actinomycetota bacterium]|nr:hypothetical protein [Actinomycetota bacterium]